MLATWRPVQGRAWRSAARRRSRAAWGGEAPRSLIINQLFWSVGVTVNNGDDNYLGVREKCSGFRVGDKDCDNVSLVTWRGGWRPSGEIVKDGGGVAPGVNPLLRIVSKCKNYLFW